MGRTARRGPENKKKYEGSDWESLKPSEQMPPSQSEAQHKTADRLHKGQKGNKKGSKFMTGEKILHKMISQNERREKRRQKRKEDRETKKRCFKCRLPGHTVEDCLMSEAAGEGTGVCYRCGSVEHFASRCEEKGPKDHMPFASCYVCGKTGHLARTCPDNPQGLYPKGGGCRTCGSVHHFQRDCPEYLSKQGISSNKLTKISVSQSVDAMDNYDSDAVVTQKLPQKDSKKKHKVIKF